MRTRQYIILSTLVVIALLIIMSIPRSSQAGAPIPGMEQPFLTPGNTSTGPIFTTPATLTPLPTPTPLLTPTATFSAPGCDAAPFPVDIGGTVIIRPGVNIRSAPTLSSPSLFYLTENLNFIVLDGPVCGDNYYWWRVRGHGVNGWVAERDRNQDFIRFIFPSPNATPVCSSALDLQVGEVRDLVTGVRVRSEPNLDGLVLTVAQIDQPVTIVGSTSVCGDGYNWWLVDVEVAGFPYRGWLVEGSLFDDYYIEIPTVDPDAICSIPLELAAGDRRRVRYTDGLPKSLRASPGPQGDLLFTLVNGVPFEIIEGPVCAGGMNYWFVRILTSFEVTGWLAEGPRPNYWSRPFTSDNAYPPP